MLDVTKAKQNTRQLTDKIKAVIKQNGGQISFAEFMQQALYAPQLGYYNNPNCPKFGAKGDFITAPMLGQVFASCVANQCGQLFTELPVKKPQNILEIGAGNGQLAQQLTDILPIDNYFILEASPELQRRQQTILANNKKISWVSAVPKKFTGIIIANEVLDALPVHLFTLQNKQFTEKVVTVNNNQLEFRNSNPSQELLDNLLQLNIANSLDNYQSEICLLIPGFLKSLATNLESGAILLIDYGFLAKEYYHPDRNSGTLMCHHNHYAHVNPLILPGRQDITAHVNFSQLIHCAEQYNLQISGFSSLANFILSNNLSDILAKSTTYNLHKELNTLLSPAEMGEIFKVLLLTTK